MPSVRKILVVEDDDMLRQIITIELSKYFNVMEAVNGEQAIERVAIHKPTLIILDLMLPVLDGFQVLEKIRANKDPEIANVHIIILSNLGDEKDIAHAQNYGVDAYYIKASTRTEDLFAAVRTIMHEIEKKPIV